MLGAVYNGGIENIGIFLINFIAVHALLFGGVNAYNSYFDKDDGPIGGLEKPPKMKRWMYYGSLIIQILGLIISISLGTLYVFLYIISMALSLLYSSPMFRFKGRPILSLLVVGLGTAFSTNIMGFIASGGVAITQNVLLGSIGSTFIILSMYPFSQAYQIAEDKKRGDNTFVVRYGILGIKRIFKILFMPGIFILAFSLNFIPYATLSFVVFGIVSDLFILRYINTIEGKISEYKKIMKTKYYSGLLLTLAMAILLFFV